MALAGLMLAGTAQNAFSQPDAGGLSVNFGDSHATAGTSSAPLSGASREFRSTLPNGRQLLEQYLQEAKSARHVVRVSDLLDNALRDSARLDGISGTTPDEITIDECRNHFGNPSDPQYWYKNRYNSCMVTPARIIQKNGQGVEVGSDNFRLTVIGKGSLGLDGDGTRSMRYQFATDGDSTRGAELPPDWDYARFGFKCISYDPNVTCGLPTQASRITIGTIRAGNWTSPEFTLTENSAGAGGVDNKVFFDLSYTMQAGPSWNNSETPVQITRCDQAKYASGGGCVFMDVDSWIQYHKSDIRIKAVAEHIGDAFDDITRTKPGLVGTEVMGSRKSGAKLSRMYEGYEPSRYNRNNYIAVQECKKWWGDDYATSDPAGPRDCDEYPFRSTFEGAAYGEIVGGHSKWSYSARVVPSSDNRLAGNALGEFYRQDHIIHSDRFWVDIAD
ncbi:hypothetical protein BC739_009070 [Kutzneria viridogrisea]|uniref:Deoxyribonuclease NucA/NucB domain-containing protein n=1 Tax=Kutzneria viridogrisea TaxID=47990 RepID=A0ABR6BY27_9PSEU|nr:hypothetical protein [Kutzneria viridogrisea]